ncbi:MAG: hypothetical protein RLW87_20640 [Alphaproteobacteria bacterium]
MAHMVGDIAYRVSVEENRIEILEYVCRTVRGGRAFYVHKIPGVTWVKHSRKHGDYGWAPHVHPDFRRNLLVDRKISHTGMARSKKAALRLELAAERKRLAFWKKKGNDELVSDCERDICRLQQALRRAA